MKNYIILIFVALLALNACNPNKEMYEMIDAGDTLPLFKKNLEYTITSTDYSEVSKLMLVKAENSEDSAWAKSIASYNSFNTKYSANDNVPDILATKFSSFKAGSDAMVTYNQYIGEMFGTISSSELSDNDYIEMGGTIETNLYFSENDNPDDYLPNYLLSKYPDATENNYTEVFYKYPNIDTQAGSFYMFDGSIWTLVENSRVLTANDYDSMGEANGQPGEYNNFSADALPANYLPQFLKIEYPYSQVNDIKIIVCDLYGYNDPIYAITCAFDGENWSINFPGLKTTAQFVRTKTKWIFDPTVRFTMGANDFQLIVDHIATVYPDLVNSYGSGDYYTGASAYYSNFDIRISKRREKDPEAYPESLSDEDALALIWERLKEGIVIMLKKKFPDAIPDVEGVEVNYFITFDTFNDDYEHVLYNIQYKCTSAGSPPEFEMVTDAEIVE